MDWEIVPRTQRNNRSRQTTGRCYCLASLLPLFRCLSVNSIASIDTQCRQEGRGQSSREVSGGVGALFNVLATALQMSAILSI